jgi:hypothetical protein
VNIDLISLAWFGVIGLLGYGVGSQGIKVMSLFMSINNAKRRLDRAKARVG